MPDDHADSVSRRRFLAASAGTALALPLMEAAEGAVGAESASEAKPVSASRQATGMKLGELTDTSVIVWTRLTAHAERNNQGVIFPQKKGKEPRPKVTVAAHEIEGACPGAAGRVRVRYGTKADLSDARETDWADVSEATDYTHHFRITGLQPDTQYRVSVETSGPGGSPVHAPLAGRFETAPSADTPSNLRFCVMTCQGYPDRGHPDGHHIYPSMLALQPKFVSLTGDVIYYDNDEPVADSVELARLHWERMFSLPRQVELLRNAASYWLKDDHDTLKNDAWPGQNAGTLTYAEGQRIFREQTPMSEKGYRTFRWGRDVQVWLTDGRDYRSPNKMADGPEKTIWGAEQKEWFKRTVAESDATWKILISPTPLVGPDRKNKNDNHANEGFTHEGNEIRAWIKANVPENFFVLCGDRHWQYHSVHPETGVQEFSVGAASDEHAGGTPGENPAYHKFHRVKGGFLSVTLRRDGNESEIVFEHRDVMGSVVYEWKKRRAVSG